MIYSKFLENLSRSQEGLEYLQIIEEAKRRSLKRQKGFEIHHIFPKGLGGSDKEGLVNLTTFEHVKVHYLLAVATQERSMLKAMRIISGTRLRKLTDLEKVTLQDLERWSEIREKALKVPCSPEGRKKISEKACNRWKEFKESGKIEEIRKNISKGTKEGMQSSEVLIKVRANLGSKWYYCKETGETMHWHPWMPIPDLSLWQPGRKPMSQKAKEKLSTTQKKLKRVFYYSDFLQINKRFGPEDTIPEGFKKGKKMEYCGNRRLYEIQIRTEKYKALGAADKDVIHTKQLRGEN